MRRDSWDRKAHRVNFRRTGSRLRVSSIIGLPDRSMRQHAAVSRNTRLKNCDRPFVTVTTRIALCSVDDRGPSGSRRLAR
jgi:hypothetical protein